MTKFALTLKVLTATAAAGTLAACATVEEAVAEATSETYRTTLTGAQVPGGGDRDGYARAEISVSDEASQICYDLNDIRGLGTITAAHVHRGAPGTNGPPVMPLRMANEGGYKNCVGRAEWTEDSIENNPGAYYVQIHTTEFPNGAIRGQLARN